MRSRWIWITTLLVYGVFSLWYNNLGGALTPEEIGAHLVRFEKSSGVDPERLAVLRAFLEGDDGGEFFMLNLIRLREGPVGVPHSDQSRSAEEVLGLYTQPFMRSLFVRAGHPAFIGWSAGSYLEHWEVEADPGWTFAGAVRYRSRRDLIELVTDPSFEPLHANKIAAIANTLAFPLTPGAAILGPRIWVPLVLALLAALAQIALSSRRRT